MFLIPASGFARFPVIKQIAQVFGLLMQGIFVVLSKANILSIAACITVFTIITKLLLLPLTIKQQKFTKVSAMMNPEIQEIQKKYEGRTDQASMERMRMEQQAVYDKYGSSMTAGCLPSLLQIVLLFGLYPVIYDFATYVPQIANYTEAEVTKMYTFLGMNLQHADPHHLRRSAVPDDETVRLRPGQRHAELFHEDDELLHASVLGLHLLQPARIPRFLLDRIVSGTDHPAVHHQPFHEERLR